MLTDKQLQIYNTLVRKVYASSSLQALRVCLLSGLQALVPYHSAAFFLVNPKTSELSELLFYGLDSFSFFTNNNSDQLHASYKTSLFTQTSFPFVNRSSIFFNNGLRERNEDRTDFLLPQSIYYMACMPIFHQEHLCGELSLHRKQEQEDFSDDEMMILRLLHEHINDRFFNLCTRMHNSTSQVVIEEWHLTKRETQIASLVTCGRTNKQMALDLGVSENTIKTFLKRLFNKMGVHSRSELISTLYRLTPSGNYNPE